MPDAGHTNGWTPPFPGTVHVPTLQAVPRHEREGDLSRDPTPDKRGPPVILNSPINSPLHSSRLFHSVRLPPSPAMALAWTLSLPLPQPAQASPCRRFLSPRARPRGIPVRLACRAAMAVATDKVAVVVPDKAAVAAVGVGEELPEGYDQMMPTVEEARRRRAGVLLHPTSLRGPHGIGDLGSEAVAFLRWLHDAGCTLWQVLPLVPPGRKSGEDGSPYSGQDANCGNTLLISLEELVKDGLLMEHELPDPLDVEYVDFDTVANLKEPLIAKAAERLLQSHGELRTQFDCFKNDPNISGWLEDAALFAAIDKNIDALSWYEWPEPLKNRHLGALEDVYQKEKDFIEIFMAQQFLFQRQWQRIRKHAQKLGISIMGDMPIYVGYHSADVWANRKSFLLDKNGFPTFVSGVPPDAFSETGQLWNSPLYDWKAMEAGGFTWWIKRINRALDLYDEFRIDHFRGLSGFWAVPAESKVALVGSWRAGPRNAFFDALFKAVGRINIIAEDLGVITEDVVDLRKSIGAPGMAVLQFAFGGGSDNPHLPQNHEFDQVVYTGTHDNDTVLGWWQSLPEEEKQTVVKYVPEANKADISWALITAALSSVARTSMVTMQDILGLDSSAKMNTPATQKGNWRWMIPSSVSFDNLSPEATKLKELLALYNRL